MRKIKNIIINPVCLLSRAVDLLLRHKRLFISIAVIFFVVVGISALCRGGIGPPPRRTDLTVFLRAAEAILSGEDIYIVTNERGWNYVYPPLLAILLTPFARLPLLLNTSLWYALSAAALCGSVFLSARLAGNRTGGMRAAVMAALFCMPTLVESMTRGQVGVMSVFLTIAILYMYMRGWAVWTGLLFAFSVILKPSPFALIIVFFLARREWKICAAALSGIFFFGWIFPAIAIGAGRNWLFLKEWSRILGYAAVGTGEGVRLWSQLATPLAWDNQSLTAIFTRWAWPTETALAAHGNSAIRLGVNVFGAAALLSLVLVNGRKRNGPRRQKQTMLEYSLFPALMLLISPVSEIHHFTTFFALFLPVFFYLDELPRNSALFYSLTWGGFIAGVTQILGYVKPLNQWGLPAIGALLFWCVSFALLLRLRR